MLLPDIGPVRINGVLYSVLEETEPFTNDDGVELMGDVRYEQARIRISSRVDAQLLPRILLHEVIHALLYQAGHCNHKEGLVLALEYGLTELFRENPRLARYLMDNGKE